MKAFTTTVTNTACDLPAQPIGTLPLFLADVKLMQPSRPPPNCNDRKPNKHISCRLQKEKKGL